MSIRNSFGLDFHFDENEIYLDSATASKVPNSSLEKMNQFYTELGAGVNRGTHKKSMNANKVLETSRSTIANVFSISPANLAFLPSRETAMTNLLLSGLFNQEDEILTSTLDDHSILAPIFKLRTLTKTQVNYLSLENEGNLINSIKEKISEKTKAIILSGLTLGVGAKRDWQEITKVAKDSSLLFILDISNSVGHQEYDFSKLMPDAIISSGNIGALGPQGTAFQVLSDEMIKRVDPILVGGGSIISLDKNGYKLSSSITKFETGSLNIGGISALSNSLASLCKIGFETISNHENNLHTLLEKGLGETNKIDIIKHPNLNYGPITSFKSDEIDSHDIAIILEDLGSIFVRSGALCSHLFMDEIKQESLVQISTHFYNTENDINSFLETLNSIMTEI